MCNHTHIHSCSQWKSCTWMSQQRSWMMDWWYLIVQWYPLSNERLLVMSGKVQTFHRRRPKTKAFLVWTSNYKNGYVTGKKTEVIFAEFPPGTKFIFSDAGCCIRLKGVVHHEDGWQVPLRIALPVKDELHTCANCPFCT